MNRRSFFARTFGAAIAAVAAPFLPPLPPPLAFKGIPLVADDGPAFGTIGAIDRASFTFWRNRQGPYPHNSAAFDALYERMRQIHREAHTSSDPILIFTPGGIMEQARDYDLPSTTLDILQ